MLHGQEVQVHKSVHTIRQAALLRAIELPGLDSTRHALVPTGLRELVGFCQQKKHMLAFQFYFSSDPWVALVLVELETGRGRSVPRGEKGRERIGDH